MSSKYIIALDQGTTSSRAVLFDSKGSIAGISQKEFTQIFPNSGWVEHDPNEIWDTQWEVFTNVIKDNSINAEDIARLSVKLSISTSLSDPSVISQFWVS